MATITITTTIQAPIEKVWERWTNPNHITKWSFATNEWHAPWAKNDLRVGGEFSSRMEARDGSMGFDFAGIYTAVETNKLIEYNIADGRQVSVKFESEGSTTKVTETFEAETENPIEMQEAGWQMILDNFKNYAEGE